MTYQTLYLASLLTLALCGINPPQSVRSAADTASCAVIVGYAALCDYLKWLAAITGALVLLAVALFVDRITATVCLNEVEYYRPNEMADEQQYVPAEKVAKAA